MGKFPIFTKIANFDVNLITKVGVPIKSGSLACLLQAGPFRTKIWHLPI